LTDSSLFDLFFAFAVVKAQPKPAADAGFGGFKVVKKKGKK